MKVLPGGSEARESACNAGDWGSIPGQGRSWKRKWQPTPVLSPGESPWTEGAWRATVRGVAEPEMAE